MSNLLSKRLVALFFLCLCMFSEIAFTAETGKLTEIQRKQIETAFPQCRILEVEEDSFQGRAVTEVELITSDGRKYEVFISKGGQVLKAASGDDELPLIGGELTLGLGVRGEWEIYKDVKSETEPVPFIAYENGPFEIQAYGSVDALYRIYKRGTISVTLEASLKMGEGYDPDDSVYFEGMDELHTLYYAGIEIEGGFAGFELGFEFLQDVSGEHEGQEVSLSLEYPWNIGGFEFRPSLSLTWLSKDYTDYFYGVSTREVKSDRPFYSPDSSFELSLQLMVLKTIYGNLKGVGIVEVCTFGGEITDSPLVEKDYEIQGVFGIMYTF